MTRSRVLVLWTMVVLACQATMSASTWADDDNAATVEFVEAKVRPLLVNRCHSCHAGPKVKGGLRLDSRANAMVGGPSGPAGVDHRARRRPHARALRQGLR